MAGSKNIRAGIDKSVFCVYNGIRLQGKDT